MARIAKMAVVQLLAAKSNELIDIPAGGIVLPQNKPTARQLVRASGEGKRAAIVLVDVLAEAGVDMTFEPGTPVFSIDPQDPNLVMRRLNGRVARGYFKDGKFVEVP